MHEKALLTLVLIGALCLSSYSYAYRAYGDGAVNSCGNWIEVRKTPNTWEGLVVQAWVSGFVSGYGFSGNTLKETDVNAILAWVDNYCKEKPLDTVAEAAEMLIFEMQE
jgi:hypothetical protein